MVKKVFRKKFFLLGISISVFFVFSSVFAANPVAPFNINSNILDPGSPNTPWGGCGPFDANCYFVKKITETKTKQNSLRIIDTPPAQIQKTTSLNISNQFLISALRNLLSSNNLPNDILQKLKGPQGIQGPKGDVGMNASPTMTYIPAGIIPSNPVTGYSGGTLLGATDLSSTNFITTNAKITTLKVTGDSELTGALNVNGAITLNNSFSQTGANTFSTGTGAISLNGATTVNDILNVNGRATFTKVPTLAHAFTTWPLGVSNISDATVYINPASAVADTNLFGVAVNGVPRFIIDAEGDIYAKNIILEGSVTSASNTIGTLNVTDNTTLGDAGTDIITFNANTINIPNNLNFDSNTLFIDSTNNRVGVGTTSPRTKLEVGGDGAILATGTYNSGWTEPNLGAGTRLLWYPRKAAFRAGSVTGTQWNDANIGAYSIAMGENTIASGSSSTAMGSYTTASNDSSTAMGYGTTASGSSSTAMGMDVIASGSSSTAMGMEVVASGNSSMAMGFDTTASGMYSTAMGRGTTASGSSSTAMGYLSTASNDVSIAMGEITLASGKNSTAMGFGTTASGMYSTAMGRGTTASGMYSTGIGGWITTDSYNSFAIGRYNVGGGTAGSWVATDPLFEIGIGADASNKANALTVLKNGNVGIGTPAPNSKLDVSGNVRFYDQTAVTGFTTLTIRAGAGQATNLLQVWQDSSGNSLSAIDSSGRIGIGTTSPTQQLDLTKSINLVNTIDATTGIIYKNGVSFINNFQPTGSNGYNTFVGLNSGNFTMAITPGQPWTASYNTAVGQYTLNSLTTGRGNIAIGRESMRLSTTAEDNTAVGTFSLYSNITGNWNTSLGAYSLYYNTTGLLNVAIGNNALRTNTTGQGNTAIGEAAGFAELGGYSGAVDGNLTGTNNTYLGRWASPASGFTNLTNSTAIGYNTKVSTDNTVVIGNTSVVRTLLAGNVGIGTTSPVYNLHIYSGVGDGRIINNNSTTGATASDGSYWRQSGLNTVFGNQEAGDMQFFVDNTGTRGIYIKSGGNVGIGTTAPTVKLQLSGSGHAFRLTDSGDSENIRAAMEHSDGNGGFFTLYDDSEVQQVLIRSYGASYFNAGNVGIGTTSPAATLDVNGNNVYINPQSAGNALVQFRNTGVLKGISGYVNATNNIYIGPDGSAIQGININSSGNVGIGTTGPATKLEVQGATPAIRVAGTSGSVPSLELSSAGIVNWKLKSNWDSASGFAILQDTTERLVIKSGGNVGIGTTNPGATLDVNGKIKLSSSSNEWLYSDGSLRFDIDNNNDQTDRVVVFSNNNGANELMRIQENGNVGIGTTAPGALLDVAGNAIIGNSAATSNQKLIVRTRLADQSQIILGDGTNENVGLIRPSGTTQLAILTGGSEKVRIDSSGNVGIGTTSPEDLFHISGDNKLFRFTDTASTDKDFTLAISDEGLGAGLPGVEFNALVDGGNQMGYNFNVNSVSKVSITNAGNVGIGTTNPGYKLDVNGVISSNNNIYFGNNDDQFWQISNAGDDGIKAKASVHQISLIADGNELLTGNSSGNVGIGTTAPGSKLDVVGVARFGTNPATPSIGIGFSNDSLISWRNSANTADISAFQVNGNNDLRIGLGSVGTNVNSILFYAGGSTERARINSDGNVGIGTTSPGAKLELTAASGVTGLLINNNDNVEIKFSGTNGANIWQSTANQQMYISTNGANFNLGANTDASHLVIQSGGNVGIGTTAPGKKLDVTGALRVKTDASGDSIVYMNSSGVDKWTTYLGSGSDLRFYSGGDKVTFLESGNVGIGTTAPGEKLHIYSTDSTGQNLKIETVHATLQPTATIDFALTDVADGGTNANIKVIQTDYQNNAMAFFTESGNSNSERMRIHTNGNVGIGTTAPYDLLDVSKSTAGGIGGRIVVTNPATPTIGNEADIAFKTSSSFSATYYAARIAAVDPATSDRPDLRFYLYDGGVAGGTEKLRILNSGNVGIGTTSPVGALDVERGAGSSRILTVSSNGNKNPVTSGYTFRVTNDGSANNYALAEFSSSVGNVVITNAGNVGIGTTSPGYKLDINGDTRIQNGSLIMPLGYSVSWPNGVTIGGWDANIFAIKTASNERLRIDSTGNVGIGTTSPTHALDVAGDIRTQWSLRVSNSIIGASDLKLAYDNNVNNTGLIIKSTTGNVGIGTTSPQQKLHLVGRQRFESTEPWIEFYDGSIKGYIGTASPNQIFTNSIADGDLQLRAEENLIFGSGGNNVRMVIAKTTGNVGIGTTAPGTKFEVNGAGSNVYATVLSGAAGVHGLFSTGRTAIETYFGTSGTTDGIITGSVAGDTVVRGNAGKMLFSSAGATPQMTILNNGNVGIGTTGPSTKLHVNSNWDQLRLESTDENQVYSGAVINLIAGSSPKRFDLQVGSASNTRVGAGNFGIYDLTNNAARFVINQNGNVGIGTTAPSSLFEIYNSGASAVITLTGTAGKILNSSGDLYLQNTANANTFFYTNNNERMRITSTGNVGIGTTAPSAPLEVKGTGTGATIAKFTDVNTTGCTLATGGTISCSSDVRLKKNIEDINYGLDTLLSLKPVLYNWNYETDGSTKSLGFIAQEVESVIPKLVSTDTDGMKSLNTTGMVPVMVKAIQDLNLKINEITLPISEENTFGKKFFDNMKNWLASVGNGIEDFYANRVRTKEFCVSDNSGETCITKTQLDTLLSNSGMTPVNNNPPSQPTPSEGEEGAVNPPDKGETGGLDTEAPTITLNGEATINLNIGDTYTESGATVTDNVDTEIAIIISGNVDTNTPGTYTITYTATDTAGNTSVMTRTINVAEVL